MPTTFERYYQAIEPELEIIKNEYMYKNKSNAFVHYFLKHKYNMDDMDVIECVTDGSNDQGIDAIYISGDKGDEIVDFYQFKLPSISNISRSSLDQETALKFLNAYKKFIGLEQNDTIIFNDALIRLKGEYDNIENMKCIHNLYIVQFTSSEKNENFAMLEEEIKEIAKNTGNLISIHYINANGIIEIYDSIYSKDYPSFLLKYSDVSNSMEDDTSKMFVIKTTLKDLYMAIKNHFSIILDSNIRYAIGTGNSDVNNGMFNTIRVEPENFFLYNNGITFLCNSCNIRNSSNREMAVTNGCVVNGGQTLGVIKEYYDKYNEKDEIINLEKAYILVRLVQLKNSDITDSVVINLNKQNKTLKSFSFSNDPIMRSLQKGINEQTNYFIEIKDNEFEFKSKYIPADVRNKQKKDVLKIERVVQIFASYMDADGKGNTVKNSKEKIITADFMEEIKNEFIQENILKSIDKYNRIYEYIYSYRSSKKGHNSELLANKMNEPSLILNDYLFLNTADFMLLYVLGKVDRNIENFNNRLDLKLAEHEINNIEHSDLYINVDERWLVEFIVRNSKDYFLGLPNYSATDISRLTKNRAIHDELAADIIKKLEINLNIHFE